MEGLCVGIARLRHLLGRALFVAFACSAVVGVAASPAFGHGGSTVVQCDQGHSCTLSASTPGQSARSSVAAVKPVSPITVESNQCVSPTDPGQTVACTIAAFGWIGSSGCYYKLDPGFEPPAFDTADQPPAGQTGNYYLVTCFGGPTGTGGGVVWLATSATPAPGPTPAAATLAQQAVSRLALPGFTIDASPALATDQLVGLPTWLWLAAAEWQATTATAAVPGESVTATATPIAVTWNLGDGTTIVCHGPGTPYSVSDEPGQRSPTCGHTFTTSSAGQPDDAFTVTATVSWSVTWVGDGASGTIPDLENTALTTLRVATIESLNTPRQ